MADSLCFDTLRYANRMRQKEWPGSDQADEAFRALEVAGEAGEVSGAVKKYLRAKRGIKGSTASLDDIAAEIGDLIISVDLLADALSINLSVAVRSKFNSTSEKYEMKTVIGEADSSTITSDNSII